MRILITNAKHQQMMMRAWRWVPLYGQTWSLVLKNVLKEQFPPKIKNPVINHLHADGKAAWSFLARKHFLSFKKGLVLKS